MKTFVAQVANFFGQGNTRTDYEDGSWSQNVISCTLGRYRLRIEQDRSVITNELRPEGFVHTTQIEVTGVKTYSEGEAVVDDVCWLLSLASMSQVVSFEGTFDHRRRARSVSGEAMYFRPLIREYSLRLLSYKGRYLLYSGASRRFRLLG